MKSQWILHYAGTSEDDQAHLRLLLRSARKQLASEWVWGDAPEADLVISDGRAAPGQASVAAPADRAVAAARIIEAGDPAPAGLFLQKPLHRDTFAALLNDVTRAAGGESSPQPAAPASGDVASPAASSAKAAEPGADDNLMRPLLHYLPKRVLGGPAWIDIPGAPPLVIDPESRTFWVDGSLTSLEPYVREPLRFGDWTRLTSDELHDIHSGLEPKPFAYLIWLDSYLHSKGVLSRRFDPEGTYRVTKRLDLANDYPRALRISAQMNQPRRLDAIARASGADLAEVFDVVNAYEAIGCLEWTRSGTRTP